MGQATARGREGRNAQEMHTLGTRSLSVWSSCTDSYRCRVLCAPRVDRRRELTVVSSIATLSPAPAHRVPLLPSVSCLSRVLFLLLSCVLSSTAVRQLRVGHVGMEWRIPPRCCRFDGWAHPGTDRLDPSTSRAGGTATAKSESPMRGDLHDTIRSGPRHGCDAYC